MNIAGKLRACGHNLHESGTDCSTRRALLSEPCHVPLAVLLMQCELPQPRMT